MIEYVGIGAIAFALILFILAVIYIIKDGPEIITVELNERDIRGAVIKYPYIIHKGKIVYLGSNQEMKNKFQTGDDVYIKRKAVTVSGDGARVVVRFKELQSTISDLISLDVNEVFTKEEMLAELNKPELPKVGYVYSEPPYHKTNAKVVFMNEKDVVLEDDSKLLRVVSIKTIQENFKFVHGPLLKDGLPKKFWTQDDDYSTAY